LIKISKKLKLIITDEMKNFIQKNIYVMTSERNTNTVRIDSNSISIQYDNLIDGNTVEEVVYCKICSRDLECDFEINEIVEHVKNTHNII
jgi:hypothetical protein